MDPSRLFSGALRSLSDRVFESAFGYRYIRGFFHLGLRLGPVRKALALREGDRVLDVGCGPGDYSTLVDCADFSYTGVDSCEHYIEEAQAVYGKPWRQFVVGDIRELKYGPGSFTKAMILGVMHHLTDSENLELLRILNKIVSDSVVIMDLSPGGWHVLNTLLCRLDRGHHARVLAAQCELIGQVMDVVSVGQYYVRSGIHRYSLIVARPRR